MKKLFYLLTFTTISLVFGQQKATPLQVTLLEKSKAPLSTPTHTHTYSILNSTDKDIEYSVVTQQGNCNKNTSKVSINLHSDKNASVSKIVIKANTRQTFTVKTQRNYQTKLGTWSCIEIFAVDQYGTPVSNTAELSQLIPDPNNFQ
ncbi:MAG: hypothetical protein ACPGU9_07860 [Flavobacteriaceae bacterium]